MEQLYKVEYLGEGAVYDSIEWFTVEWGLTFEQAVSMAREVVRKSVVRILPV
jgi:hypothetical protein